MSVRERDRVSDREAGRQIARQSGRQRDRKRDRDIVTKKRKVIHMLFKRFAQF